jgi:hypothetical protein
LVDIMNMVDMKCDMQDSGGVETQGVVVAAGSSPDMPEYPYSLRITIEDDKVEELGLDKCRVGDKLTITCNCEVVEVSEREDQGGMTQRVELQIQKIGNDEDDNSDTGFVSKK